MNPFRKAFVRTFQKGTFLFTFLVKFNHPEVVRGEKSFREIPKILKKHHCCHPLIVCGPNMYKRKALDPILNCLSREKIGFEVYHEVKSDPEISMAETGYLRYREGNCDCIIAFGGGSSIDCAKAIGARVANPKRTLIQMRGMLRVKRKTPLFVAIPTTAGSGSEATLACVLTNGDKNDKYAINDPKLTPDYAVLDASFMASLPPETIANCGIDALSHSLESYLGRSSTEKSRNQALKSLLLIKENLKAFHDDPFNSEARSNMLEASFLAGETISRAYVGYVHALAHAVGGKYHLPHGYVIGVLLPHVMRAYGKKAYRRLAEVNEYLAISPLAYAPKLKAEGFISYIEKLLYDLDMPTSFGGLIKEEDFLDLAKHADKEANLFYPVPRLMDVNELAEVLKEANK